MAVYKLTGIAQNATGVVGFFRGVNDVLMFGWLGALLLIGMFFVTFIMFVRVTGNTGKSLTASSFICFGLALIMRAMSLVSDTVMFISLVLLAGVIAFTWRSSS